MGLLSYRSAPLDEAYYLKELLQGHKLRSRLPDITSCPGQQDVWLQSRQQTLAKVKTLPELPNHAVVRLRGYTWDRRARVLGRVAPRFYRVVTKDHRVLRRNRQHLLATRECFQSEVEEDESDDEDTI